MKHEKCIFVPRCEYSGTKNFDVIMQKQNLVVQIIIGHKVLDYFQIKRRRGKK